MFYQMFKKDASTTKLEMVSIVSKSRKCYYKIKKKKSHN